MASDVLFSIKEIKGESKDAVLPGSIHISSFTWHLEAPFSGSQRAGAINVGALVLVKEVDASSVDLMDYMLRNKLISKASLTARKAGDIALDYYVVNIFNGAVKSVSKSFVGEKIMETVQIVFQRFEYEYREQSGRGSAAGQKIAIYDVSENK